MRTIYTPSLIDKDVEDNLWQSAIIVFDTCALLDFYFLTPDYQIIMSDILVFLKERVWLPAQVYNEYCRNYSHAYSNPIKEKYQDADLQKNKFVDTLEDYISQWERKYYHPYISDDKLKTIKNLLFEIRPKIAEIKKEVSLEYQNRRKEIRDITKNDNLKNVLDKLVRGEAFSFTEIKEIVKEGHIRYKNQIPPGYKDAETKEGIRQYGDLIIWKEIIRFAKDSHKDIIFVSNDSKPDWLILDETSQNPKAVKPNPAEVGKPRRELLAEFEEETQQKIWFYSPSSFITKLEEIYQPTSGEIAFYGKLGVVRNVLEQRERERMLRLKHTGDAIFLRCNHCGELFAVDSGALNFEWEGEFSEERGMGPENEYTSNEYATCPNCNKQIDLKFHVWEYPMGTFNYQNIEADGANVEKPIDLSDYICFESYQSCHRCGEYRVLNQLGLCDSCQEEFDRFVNSDD